MRPISPDLIAFLKGAEGCWLTGKADLVGKPTWGYGHTGPDVVVGATISVAQADSLLFADAVKAAMKLAAVVRPAALDALAGHQYDALVSFVFNLGCDPKWTLWALLNAGKPECAPVQMMRFDKAHVNGKLVEVPGLFNRRAAEVALWKTADVSASLAIVQAAPIAAPSSADTANIKTPPTPMSPKPAMTSKSVVSAGGVGLLAIVMPWIDQLKTAGDQLNAAITPYIGSSAVLQHLQGELMTVLAVAAAAAAVFAFLKNREAS